MARTPAGTQLTEAHRAAQLAVRAGSLRNLVQLWRVVDPADLSGTIETFAQAAAILAGQGFDQSGVISARYYDLFRRAEGVPGAAPAATAAARPALGVLAADVRGAALSGIIKARRAGLDLEAAKRNGFVRAAGVLGKLVLNGGRRTLLGIVERDGQALGWARVTSSDPCPFCRMLASRGPVYKSGRSADFETHDDCACTVETVYRRGYTGLTQAFTYEKEWNEAQRIARETGNGSTGTKNDALNNYRRYLAGTLTEGAPQGTEGSG